MSVAPSNRTGNIVHFEHVNLRVPDHRLATLFFIQGLGFTRDPTRMVGVRNMWVNVGQQQFHLPIGEARPFAGEIGLTVPSLAEAKKNLRAVAAELHGSAFSVKSAAGALAVSSPWGHRFRLHPAGEFSGRLPQAIPYVRFFVPSGSAAGIATFYHDLIGAPAELGRDGRRVCARVAVGVDQHFLFTEQKNIDLPEHRDHVAIYITAYEAVRDALKRRKLLSAPDRREQFRFATMAGDDGTPLYAFEHEVRSLFHPDFRKPLYNRVPVPYRVD